VVLLSATTLVLGASVAAAATNVGGFSPTPTAPSTGLGTAANTVISAVEWGALAIVVIGGLYGAGKMAFGHYSNMAQRSESGRAILLSAVMAAFAIGALMMVLTWAFNIGVGAAG
jgi:hypothetical protein